MTLIIISLVSLLLIFQLGFTFIFKKSILLKYYRLFVALLIADYLLTVLFVFSKQLGFSSNLKSLLFFLQIVLLALFFIVYTRILNYHRKKASFLISIIIIVSAVLITILGLLIKPIYLLIFILLISLIIFLLLKPKINYPAKFFTFMIYLLIITELLRFINLSIMVSQISFDADFSLLLGIIPFILKSITVFLILSIQEKNTLDVNLYNILNFISPSKLLSTAFSEHPDGIVLTDLNKKIIFVNPNALKITGYRLEEVINKTPTIFQSGLTDESVYIELRKALSEYKTWQGEFINKKKNGDLFTELAKIITLFDNNNQPVYYLAIKTDISKEKKYLERLEYLSTHDDLTGLFRRNHLRHLMSKHLKISGFENDYFILLDLDNFKDINDQYGHYRGDDVLKIFASILKEVFENNAHLARFGGDEFAIFIYDTELSQLLNALNILISHLNQRFIKEIDESLILTISGGVVTLNNSMSFRKIYEIADKKLYQAKKVKSSKIIK